MNSEFINELISSLYFFFQYIKDNFLGLLLLLLCFFIIFIVDHVTRINNLFVTLPNSIQNIPIPNIIINKRSKNKKL